MSVGRNEFAMTIKVSPGKLDGLMSDLGFDYETTPRDKRLKLVPDEAQDAIKEHLGIK